MLQDPTEDSIRQKVTGVVTVHEAYDPCCTYDIAIIRLSTPLRFNDYVMPVCLTSSPVDAGTNCIATGWGSTKGERNGTSRD